MTATCLVSGFGGQFARTVESADQARGGHSGSVARDLPGARELVAGARYRAARGRGDLDPARQASAWRRLPVELSDAGRDHFDRGNRSIPVSHAFVRASRPRADSVGCFEQRANAVPHAGGCRGLSARGPCLHRVGVPCAQGPDHARGDPAARGPVLIGSDCNDVVLQLDSRYGTCAGVRRTERHLVRGHGGRARAAPRETIIATALGATPRVAGRAPYLPGAGRSLASTASKRARKPNETSSIPPLTKNVGVLRTPLSVPPCRCSRTRCR